MSKTVSHVSKPSVTKTSRYCDRPSCSSFWRRSVMKKSEGEDGRSEE